MKREKNKKFKKRRRNQNRSLTCRALSMMFAIVLFCSTVLINTNYVSQASSFDDMVDMIDMVEAEEDSAAVDISEETGDDLDTDINFESEESPAETYSESDDLGSSDVDFSSGENLFTDGTSESSGSAPAEEAAQPVSCIVNLKNETIEIKAEAPAGVLPNGTQMIVKAVENNTEDAEMTDQYNKLAARLTELIQNQGKNLDGFLAYSVSFTDGDGNPVEPSDKVSYSFTYKEASSPELTDPAAATVTAARVRTNQETSELELTELRTEEENLALETNENRQLIRASFQTAGTAAYTFVWSSIPTADDNDNNENKEENGEVNNNEETNTDSNNENTENNGEENNKEELNQDTNVENTEENSEGEQKQEETPDQDQIKMIRIIADEVNLRTAPSTEAEVLAAVAEGTQLPLLETVTAEDGSIWYKVSYEETEVYVRSDVAEIIENEEQEIVEEENEEEIPEEVQIEDTEGILTFTKIVNDLVEVIATTEVGVIPEDAELIVNPIEQGTDQYAETETKLNEKAEEDGYEIAGFLAYDIFFQDSEGNKIEPVDGSVNVSMHYTEPSVPEEVAQVTENGSEVAVFAEEDEFSQGETTTDQMSVTMMHLVEDENGNVNVVDMTQEGTASVETDTAGSVQKAEFETTSFSTFTITWTSYNTSYNLTVKLIDTKGNEIGEDKTLSLSNSAGYLEIKNLVSQAKIETIGEYSFYKAKVSSGPTEEGTPVTQIYHYNDGKNIYIDNNEWKYIDDHNKLYFVYKKLETVETVDHTRDGITMRMKDLVGSGNVNIGPDWNNQINIGGSYGDGTIKKGLLNTLLDKNGYPFAKNPEKNLESLFNGNPVNHLFLKTTYDETGYYEYSCFKNYAYLNSNSNFTVYDAIGTPSNADAYYYKRGNFMPYNNISGGRLSTNTNLYDEDGNPLSSTNSEYGKELYLSNGTNYQFSMYMGANFLQPKNGNAIHRGTSSPMIYEFNGDDDMWIYIDNVLVLDIGGVHDAHSGKINFNTGVVSWKDCKTKGTPVESSMTLKEIFKNAGVFPDGTKWKEDQAGNYFTGNTFKDYTTHSFKMFYMERGGSASNLHMKFNIQVIPEGQVEVRKELSNTDKEKYSNVKFAFQAYAQKENTDSNGNVTYSETEYVPLTSAVYGASGKPTTTSVKFLNGQSFNGVSYDNVFYLRPDESAIFTGLKANRKYYVKEIGVKSEEYDQVTINDTGYTETVIGENGEQTSTVKDICTDKKQVGQRPVVVYTNNCSAENSRELQITKRLRTGTTEDKFSFKIQLSDQENANLIPYANGKYYLQDGSGNYWYYNAAGALTFSGTESKPCWTSTDGIVSNVPVGYKVTVTGILSGTSFKVEEVNLNTDKYYDPEKEINGAATSGIEGADGSIKLGENANVTVTNILKSEDAIEDETFIEVSKTFNGLTETQISELAKANPPYKITVTGKKQGETPGSLVDFSQDLLLKDAVSVTGSATTWTYTWKIKGCGTGTYTIKESGYRKDGYLVDVKINENPVTNPENEGVIVETEASSYTYTQKERVTNCNKQNYEVGVQNLIVAKLTKGEGTFVWTRNPASVNERLAITNLIRTINGFDNKADLKNCYFYSGKGIEGTLIFRGAEIKYDCENILHFEYPKQWAMFAVGTYEITGGHNAEVEIMNTYNEQTADLDLVKILNSTENTETKLEGAEFDLYCRPLGNTGAYHKVNRDTILIDNDNQEELLRNLEQGQYYLKETKAPTGCVLLTDEIHFKQEGGIIILTDSRGNDIQSEQSMWKLEKHSDDDAYVLTIKNNKLYSLPSSGGSGIYGFTISGVAFITAALLLFINNKRKEDNIAG